MVAGLPKFPRDNVPVAWSNWPRAFASELFAGFFEMVVIGGYDAFISSRLDLTIRSSFAEVNVLGNSIANCDGVEIGSGNLRSIGDGPFAKLGSVKTF